MDNHAGNFLTNDNYIAGLVDSDFSVQIIKRTIRGDKLRLAPKIDFTNTNFDLIELCSSYLHLNDINHYVGTRDKKIVSCKIEKYITISRLSKCLEFADKILGCAVIRRPQLEVVRDFCSDRCVYVEKYGWKFFNTPYTDYQKELCDKIYELNSNYNYDSGYRNYTYSWLGGFVDGDGSVGIGCYKQGGNRIDIRMEPFVNFTGESHTGISNIKEMLDKIDVRYTESTLKCKVSKKLGRNKKKYYYIITVKAHESLRKLLPKLDGKLYIKQKQLELVSEYLDIRNVEKGPYSKRCYDMVEQAKELNS